ncbi:MAG TPA: type II toxin-antitoxin system Phd/YefM family antitoxin [Candidatus Limnocylindrales bacterium]|nr:type II toxin-antitoxin system Phd/YefM family antitoxin [Candidatus Limnocylindrales bacterium]
MADVVNIHAAKTHLSRLVERVEAGEEITIARAGRPVARLVPVQQRRPRRPGLWKGRVVISPDFDAPMPEIEEAFGS